MRDLGFLVLLALPRLAGCLAVNPLFAGGVIDGRARLALVGALVMIPAPALLPETRLLSAGEAGWLLLAALVAKETLLGLAIGWVSGAVFWSVQSAGFLMDNQRGASMASEHDPLSGEETSPLGSLLFQGVATVFFLGGGFLAFLNLLWSSYAVWPLSSFGPSLDRLPLFFPALVDWLMLQTLLLAGPVLAASLLTDAALGLVNRFASQLNVYILSMPVKSGLAALVMVAYYGVLIGFGPELFQNMLHQTGILFGWPPSPGR